MDTIEVLQECDQEIHDAVNTISSIQIPTTSNNTMCTGQNESGQSNLKSPITPLSKKNFISTSITD